MKSLILLFSLGGCFYIDPINQRPSLEIVNSSGARIERGQPDVMLSALVDDPDGHIVALEWRMFICDDASDFATCDQEPALGGFDREFVFDAPAARAAGGPALSLLIELDGRDDLGAQARPPQQLIIPLSNGRPSVTTSHASDYGKTIGTPIDVFAVYGDADDTAANVELTYVLFPPAASTESPIPLCPLLPNGECPDPGEAGKLQDGIRFTPDVIGEWQIQVTAKDPLGKTNDSEGITTVLETIVVVADQLPCLGVVSPAAPIAPNQLPVGEATLFQVHQIVDAIDPYPTDIGDPILGQSEFHWSIKINAGTRQSLPTETGNSLAFDPAGFDTGDVVELRVEIEDRFSPFPLTCDPADPTCQLDPTLVPACLQRQTWKVKVQ